MSWPQSIVAAHTGLSGISGGGFTADGAASFDGVDDILSRTGSTINQNAGNTGTLAFWIYPGGSDLAETVFSLRSTPDAANYFALRYDQSDSFFTVVINDDSPAIADSVVTTNTGLLTTNTWAFILMLSQGSAWQLFVNNAQHLFTTVTGSNSGRWLDDIVTSGTSILRLGASETGGSFFTGRLDEVAMWNSNLGGVARGKLYNGGRGMLLSEVNDVAAPIHYWNLSNSHGSMLADHVGGQTLTNVGGVASASGIPAGG